MPAITESDQKRFSRRAFIAFATLGTCSLGLFFLKRIDVGRAIQDFFGLEKNQYVLISNELRNLHDSDLVLFRKTKIYFTLFRMNTRRMASSLEAPVLTYWSYRLFASRSISWPYVNYPAVDQYSICSGLIRRDNS